MNGAAPIWQLPSLIAVDAALLALCWQQVFAQVTNLPVDPFTASVLGLSVWLVYMADRLFDAAKRPAEQLLTARHRFAKRFQRPLWLIWSAVLAVDLALSLYFLSALQLHRGFWLLGLSLLYFALNQLVFTRGFPKELFVAILFASGTLALLPGPVPLVVWSAFALLCLVNCLLISSQEREIDRAMGLHPLIILSSTPVLGLIALFAILAALGTNQPLPALLISAIALLATLKLLGSRLSPEAFHLLADLALLLPPLAFLLFTN